MTRSPRPLAPPLAPRRRARARRRPLAGATLLLALVVGVALGGAPPASAGEHEAEAIKLYGDGEAHYTAGRFTEALAAFERAFELEPLPLLLVNIGQCHRQLGDHAAAVAAFERFLDEDPAAENRAEVEELLAAERALLPKPAAKPPPKRAAPVDEGGDLLGGPVVWVAVGGAVLALAVGGTIAVVAASQPPPLEPTGSLGSFDLR